MKLAVLTTETTHHAFFVQKLQKSFPIAGVLIENQLLTPSFETVHAFEKKRDTYERRAFFGKKNVKIAGLAAVKVVNSVNDAQVIEWLKEIKPDVTIVFGTCRIKPEIIRACSGVMLNLHGGNPEEYRGLDSHLWAIYHRDFAALSVTLHKINAILDDGEVVAQEQIKILPNMKIFELRRATTEICVRLVVKALKQWKKSGVIVAQKQTVKGRYYSFMPSCLKEICVSQFEKYTRSLR
jgi:methionyl-tRNA formyltransferase